MLLDCGGRATAGHVIWPLPARVGAIYQRCGAGQQIREVLAQVRAEAAAGSPMPSVLALARRLVMDSIFGDADNASGQADQAANA